MTAPVTGSGPTRRGFVAGLGGVCLAFSLLERAGGQERRPLPGSLAANPMLDAWVRIAADGGATVFTGKVELGQGAVTALAQIAAEELGLPLSRLTMISGDTGRTPDEGFTSGSQSIEYGGTALRLACADMQATLAALAAARLGVDAGALTAADGVFTAPGGATVSYGEVAGDADIHREVNPAVTPRPPSAHRIVGTSVPRFDIPGKVTGGIAYVHDLRLPGMLHGRVVRPPNYGAVLAAIDGEARVHAMPGVTAVVRDGSFLAVVAAREEQAINASEALAAAARWTSGPALPDAAGIYDYLLSLPDDPHVISTREAPLPDGVRMFEATYHRPYTTHGAIGPSCAVAQFADGRMTVWCHSQGVFPLRDNLGKALRLPVADIRCIHMEGSGCYGHNGADDVALDAALLARASPGRPVRVQWMRADEFAWEPYGAAMVMKARAALSRDGRIVDWNYDVFTNTHSMRPDPGGCNLLASWYLAEPRQPAPPAILPQPAGGGDRNAIPLYAFARQKVVHHFIKDMPIRVSALRTLGAYANVFAIESFMDELALAAGHDPVAFRLAHMTDPRARAVIETVAARAQWQPDAARRAGHGRGIGFAKYKNLSAWVAVIADVEVDAATGKVAVPRAFAAVDPGLCINPDGLANQIEGGIIQSTSWTLHEAVKFDAGGIRSRDWLGYPVLTMPEVPRVEVEIINRPAERPLGSGEASQGPAAAAIANAFAAATGRRVRELPLTPDRVKAALGGAA